MNAGSSVLNLDESPEKGDLAWPERSVRFSAAMRRKIMTRVFTHRIMLWLHRSIVDNSDFNPPVERFPGVLSNIGSDKFIPDLIESLSFIIPSAASIF